MLKQKNTWDGSSNKDVNLHVEKIKSSLVQIENKQKKIFFESRQLMHLSRKGPRYKRENAARLAQTKKDLVALDRENEKLKQMLKMHENMTVINDKSMSNDSSSTHVDNSSIEPNNNTLSHNP